MSVVSVPIRRRRAVACLLLALSPLTWGCATWHPTEISAREAIADPDLRPLRLVRADGDRVVIEEAVLLGDTAIASANGRVVPFSDVTAVEVGDYHPGRSLLLAATAVTGVFLLVALAAYGSSTKF